MHAVAALSLRAVRRDAISNAVLLNVAPHTHLERQANMQYYHMQYAQANALYGATVTWLSGTGGMHITAQQGLEVCSRIRSLNCQKRARALYLLQCVHNHRGCRKAPATRATGINLHPACENAPIPTAALSVGIPSGRAQRSPLRLCRCSESMTRSCLGSRHHANVQQPSNGLKSNCRTSTFFG